MKTELDSAWESAIHNAERARKAEAEIKRLQAELAEAKKFKDGMLDVLGGACPNDHRSTPFEEFAGCTPCLRAELAKADGQINRCVDQNKYLESTISRLRDENKAALGGLMDMVRASSKQIEQIAIQDAIIRELEAALYAVLRHHPKGMAATLDQLARVERNTNAPRDARELAAAILRARNALLSSAERRAA